MIKPINPSSFYEGSFADEKVSTEYFDESSKSLKFTIEGAEAEDQDGKVLYYKHVQFLIQDWREFNITKFDVTNNQHIPIPHEQFDMLDEILVYDFGEHSLKLEGFGKKTMVWYTWVFKDSQVKIQAERY